MFELSARTKEAIRLQTSKSLFSDRILLESVTPANYPWINCLIVENIYMQNLQSPLNASLDNVFVYFS
jgi:hypothetical protein